MRMGATFWIVVLAAGAGGYYAFRRLREMEEDIRGEIADRERSRAARRAEEAPPAGPPQPAAPSGEPSAGETLEERLLALVRERPGRLQSELYPELPDVDRRHLQDVLLRLDRAGRLRRVRQKNTFRLFAS